MINKRLSYLNPEFQPDFSEKFANEISEVEEFDFDQFTHNYCFSTTGSYWNISYAMMVERFTILNRLTSACLVYGIW